MPTDLACRNCDYALTLGWYHYHDFSSGYGARTAFACANCGATHYVEHAVKEGLPDRYLYHAARSSIRDDRRGIMPPDKSTIGEPFNGFDRFVCPVCQCRGKILREEDLERGTPSCPQCGEAMEDFGFWLT